MYTCLSFDPGALRPKLHLRYHGTLAAETGAVFGFGSESLTSENPTTENCSLGSAKPCPTDVADDVITSPDDEQRSQFGHSVKTVSDPENRNRYILVSAPKSSRWAAQSGVVHVFKHV